MIDENIEADQWIVKTNRPIRTARDNYAAFGQRSKRKCETRAVAPLAINSFSANNFHEHRLRVPDHPYLGHPIHRLRIPKIGVLESVTQVAVGNLLARVSDCIEAAHNASIAMTDETGLPIVRVNFQHQLVRRILVKSEATVLGTGWVVAVRF